MRKRKYVEGLTFFMTPEMRQQLTELSEMNEVSLGKQIRSLLSAAIKQQNILKGKRDAVK